MTSPHILTIVIPALNEEEAIGDTIQRCLDARSDIIESSGFEDFAITWQAPVFDDAPQSSSAAQFGTVGINFVARKPG